jgi:DNA polymerase-3 subunit delta
VGLQVDEAEHHIGAGAFQVARPADVGFLVEAGLQLDRDAVSTMIERAGKDIGSQISALAQLALYVHPRTEAKREDIEAILGKSAEADVFELLDYILDKKPAACLKKVADLRREGVKAFEVVGVLGSQVERLKKAALMQRQGDPSQRIGQELKVHSFFLDKFLRQAAKLNDKTAQLFFGELADCDRDIKTGVLREDLAFEKLVIRLCGA